MFLWRISNHSTLDGKGGLVASSRWHTEGRPIVYFAESPAGALTEVLVHLELDAADLPKKYKLLKAQVAENVNIRTTETSELQKSWRESVEVTRTVGDAWLAAAETALLRVPSVIVPETYNVLLNPKHPDATKVKVLWAREYPWDRRLFQ